MPDTLSDRNLKKLSPLELLRAGSDIALLLDDDGQVLDVSVSDAALSEAMTEDWRGKLWADTVSDDSREKITELLDDARRGQTPSWRQVNVPGLSSAIDRPVRYCAMKINGGSRFLALGRDLQLIADLQQQLISAQETAERDFWRLRQAESRFRLLFQICRDAVLVVDAQSERVLEVNPAAEALLSTERKPGRVGSLFDGASTDALKVLLSRATSTGQAAESGLQLRCGDMVNVSAWSLRQGNSGMFLVTIVPETNGAARVDPDVERALKLIEGAPDAIVICNEDGHVLSVNPAFVELAQVPGIEQTVGQPLGNWLGRSSVDVNVLLANVRKSGRLRLYATSIRGSLGVATAVEVAGTVIKRPNSDQVAYGFIIRSAEHRGGPTGDLVRMRSADQLAELVGKVPLKELVRESADLIERMSIEAALDLTDNNRAAAAEMLGLSRQSLYVKLRRFGIGDTEN